MITVQYKHTYIFLRESTPANSMVPRKSVTNMEITQYANQRYTDAKAYYCT